MRRRDDGSGWIGWALFCGIPATFAAFAVTGPLGFLVLAATIAAFKYGSHLDKEADAERHLEQTNDEQIRREEKLRLARFAWDDEHEKLCLAHEAGALSEDEFDKRLDELLESYPR